MPLALAAFVLGSAFGSFANVAIHRVPRGRSIVSPGSSCPSCGAPIAWHDNLPLLSYLMLRGRCRACGARISVRYPIVELATGGLFVAIWLRFGLAPETPAYLAFATTLVILSFIDLEHRRIPNRVLGPAAVLGAVLLTVASLVAGDSRSLLSAAVGSVAYGGPLLLLALAYPAGMGGGDVKLAGYLGFHLGWLGLLHVLAGAIAGFFLGGVVGVVLVAAGRKGRKDPIPFGPFLAAGALIAVLAGDPLIALWLP